MEFVDIGAPHYERPIRALLGFFLAAAAVCMASAARAYPGPTNINGTSGAGYVSTAVLGGLDANCGGCHLGTANPPTNLSINGAGLGTVSIPNDRVANFTVSYAIGDGSKPYGGFLIAHNDGTTDDSTGTLGPGGDGGEHACGPVDAFPCNGTSNNNTEVMHAAPRANSGGVVSFPFTYTPVGGSCGTFTFNVWANNVNGDSSCGDTNDVPIEGSFAIQVTCPPSTDTCTAGNCGGTLVTCTSDACNDRSCNGTPSCTVTPKSGTACDDGQSCTVN